MKKTIIRLSALILILTTSISFAERSYDVELVIYKPRNISQQFRNEQWPNSWTIPNTTESVDLNRIPFALQDQFSRLNNEETSISEIAKLIDESERYDLLTFQAWRQPGLDKDSIVDILIQTGQVYTQITQLPEPEKTKIENEETTTKTASLFIQQNQLDETVEPIFNPYQNLPLTVQYSVANSQSTNRNQRVYELEGTVKIILSRFLHLYTDLLLLQPVLITPANNRIIDEDTALISDDNEDILLEPEKPKFNVEIVEADKEFTTLHGFNVKQHRRMRSGELHYIDHPMLGLVIKVSPVKKEE